MQSCQNHPRGSLHRLSSQLQGFLPRQSHHHSSVGHRFENNAGEGGTGSGESGTGVEVLFFEDSAETCRVEDGEEEGRWVGDEREEGGVGGVGSENGHPFTDL